MLYRLLEERLQRAVLEVLPEADASSILIRPCPDARHGDYQSSAVMSLAKSLKRNPRQLAADVLARLEVRDLCDAVEVAGAGFLNFRIRAEMLCGQVTDAARGGHLFFTHCPNPRTIVVDFSSPNVAKPMHVGHIRSTVLGDCLNRVLRLLGHRVITDNHIGDWGTQFGKLLVGWKSNLDRAKLDSDPIGEMERIYKLVNAASEADPAVMNAARQELVKLQAGDAENLAIWREMIALSQRQFDAIYSRLGVRFDHALGESFYNSKLKPVVSELEASGLAKDSEGAKAVFFDDVPELKAHPALVQKSDGAANYTTTDLATLQYRIENWKPDEIIYVTDGRQQLHFKQLFAIFRRWHPEIKARLVHVWFGSILGEDGKPFKTRSGETVKLDELLDEAQERALAVVSQKNPDLDDQSKREIARIIGIGAVKYADLLPNRQSDYVFSWDKMLALSGNTAPYLQYAYTRTRGILRKAGEDGVPWTNSMETCVELKTEPELSLAKHLLNFGLVLEMVASEYRPNYLCNYLYDLAAHFARFFEQCPVLKAEPAERASRLALCDVTGRALKEGLQILGIETSERM